MNEEKCDYCTQILHKNKSQFIRECYLILHVEEDQNTYNFCDFACLNNWIKDRCDKSPTHGNRKSSNFTKEELCKATHSRVTKRFVDGTYKFVCKEGCDADN